MYIYETDNCTLVEHHEGEIKETNFTYSNSYETFVLTKLKAFCNFMNEFINDSKLEKIVYKISIWL